MTRRLGASLPPELRLRAFEARLRELVAAIDDLSAAAELLERSDLAGDVVRAGAGLEDLLRAIAAAETIAHRPFRRPRGIPAPRRATRGYRQLRPFDSPPDGPAT